MIENMIDQNMMSVIGNIEMPQKATSLMSDTNTATSACCIVLTIICAN